MLKISEGETVLHFAVRRNASKAVEILLSHGADVTATDAEGNTPLHVAAVNDASEAVEVLLKHGADPGCQE